MKGSEGKGRDRKDRRERLQQWKGKREIKGERKAVSNEDSDEDIQKLREWKEVRKDDGARGKGVRIEKDKQEE